MKKKNGFIFYMSHGITNLAQKYLPDAFILALLLSAVIFVCGILFTGASPLDMVLHFNNNMWSLLAFSMQSVTMVVFSTVCVGTKPVKRLMHALAAVPKSPVQAIMLGCVMELILFPINSTFALIFGAVYAKEIGKSGLNVDYPLLVATCYCGYITWQGGICGSTTLQMATEGSQSALLLGRTLPLTETIFTPFNGAILFSLILTIPLLVWRMIPREQKDVVSVSADLFRGEDVDADYSCPERATPAMRLEYSRIPTVVMGAALLIFIVYRFFRNGLGSLDINMLNVILLCIALFFSENARHLLDLLSDAMKSSAGILIQFPIYAGLMGMMVDSGLGAMISERIVSVCTAHTMPNLVHLASSFLNIFVPSGGGQWSIEAPIYLPAAVALGTPPERVVIAAAYGDALTNLIQPFWALPLLSITKLSMRDIMGYCTIICLWGFLCTQGVMAVFALLGV